MQKSSFFERNLIGLRSENDDKNLVLNTPL